MGLGGFWFGGLFIWGAFIWGAFGWGAYGWGASGGELMSNKNRRNCTQMLYVYHDKDEIFPLNKGYMLVQYYLFVVVNQNDKEYFAKNDL